LVDDQRWTTKGWHISELTSGETSFMKGTPFRPGFG